MSAAVFKIDACMRAQVRACMRAQVRACMRAQVRACVRVLLLLHGMSCHVIHVYIYVYIASTVVI